MGTSPLSSPYITSVNNYFFWRSGQYLLTTKQRNVSLEVCFTGLSLLCFTFWVGSRACCELVYIHLLFLRWRTEEENGISVPLRCFCSVSHLRQQALLTIPCHCASPHFSVWRPKKNRWELWTLVTEKKKTTASRIWKRSQKHHFPLEARPGRAQVGPWARGWQSRLHKTFLSPSLLYSPFSLFFSRSSPEL